MFTYTIERCEQIRETMKKRLQSVILGSKHYHKTNLNDLIVQYRPIRSVMWDLLSNQCPSKTGAESPRGIYPLLRVLQQQQETHWIISSKTLCAYML